VSCNEDCPDLTYFVARAHCSVCHQTFSTAGGFDLHRKVGSCQMDGFKQGLDGVWRQLLDERAVARFKRLKEQR
jgi:hypothetical protein